MSDFWSGLSGKSFMPHGHCYLWQPEVLWSQAISDVVTALAYFAIPIMLFLVIKRQILLEFRGLILLFAAFIGLCGATHVLALITIWKPLYYLDSAMKAATAAVSMLTAIKLWPLLPKIMNLPSPKAMKEANERLEALLREREAAGEERFRLALEASPNAILVADAQGAIAFVNAQTEAMFGYGRQEMLGQPLEMLVPQSARRVHGHHVQHFREDPQMRAMGAGREVRGLRKDSSEFPAEIALGPFRYEGRLNVIAFVADISARKAAEERIRRQSSDLERSNQDLESFAYAASHDLQEPLRGVLGYLQLLERQFGPDLPPKAQRYLAQSLESGGRMRALMDALLHYSRVGRPVEAETIDVMALVQEVQRDLHAPIAEAGAKFTCDPLPPVRYNTSELRQIMQNLLSNAIKFRGARAPEIHIGCRRDNQENVFFVRDNGIGIPLEYQERLFQLFQRLHARSAYPGSGIGLAMVAKSIRAQGGRIWVESAPDQGSTFFFCLGAETPASSVTQEADS